MSGKGKILVAMSGGIDSSVAAVLLQEEGYEVIGLTMKTWDYASSGTAGKETGCCSLDSINDARALAVSRGFPHYILDIRGEFGDFVIDDFVKEYLAGRTPNPCILCNTHIKWDALLRRADMLGCEYIATGHYANVRRENGRYVVSRGLDESKDQSYVLWGLSQASLARTLFPLGRYRKTEIKELARRMGFAALADKSESYEICFVPNNDYRSFLKHRVADPDKFAEGKFVDPSGEELGTHRGYPFYTVGQRKGLEIALGEPRYVTRIIPETNTVVLGTADDLDRQTMRVRDVNLVKYERLDRPVEAVTKIRSRDPGTPATIRPGGAGVEVVFHRPVRAVAPGQSAVFYDGDDVIGGGFIDREPVQRTETP